MVPDGYIKWLYGEQNGWQWLRNKSKSCIEIEHHLKWLPKGDYCHWFSNYMYSESAHKPEEYSHRMPNYFMMGTDIEILLPIFNKI